MIGAPIEGTEIRKCDICDCGLTENRAITFFRVTFERLQTFLAPNNEIAIPICAGAELIICDHCAISRDDRIFYMAERAAESAAVRKSGA